MKRLLEDAGIAASRVEPLSRCTVAALGLGYDVARNLPRPYKPVLLPGCIFRVKAEGGLEPGKLYRDGLGYYRELGWGTVFPLPPSVEKKIVDEKEG